MKQFLCVAVTFLLIGCACVRIGGVQSVAQVCPELQKPVTVYWLQDSSTCARHNQTPWGACTTCVDYGEHRVCTIHSVGRPNDLSPDVLADEAQHLFGCRHL